VPGRTTPAPARVQTADVDVDAIVLAGGAGRRLGGVDKAGLDVGGVRLLDRVLDACSTAGRTVVVAERRPLSPAITRPIEWTREDPPGGGPVAALAAGLAVLASGSSAAAVLVLATDLVRLGPADVARLVSAHGLAPGSSDGTVFVDGAGHRQPLAAIYRRAALARALAGAQPVNGQAMRAILAVLSLAEVPDLGASADCDTPEQLRIARACWPDRAVQPGTSAGANRE
jgi:molybdopterin-guanine dinucleotide biosynthesis protein A